MNENFDTESFWNRLNTLIKNSSYTQNSLSVKIGLPERAIGNWSTKKTPPDLYSCYLICKELNTTVEYLITGSDTPTHSQMNKQEKLSQLKSDLARLLSDLE